MTCREKKAQKKNERDIKLANGLLLGRVKYVQYSECKKPAQRNIKGGGGSNGGGFDEIAGQASGFIRLIMPSILDKLSMVDDPRDPDKIEHSAGTLMIYGVLMFLCHAESCRDANRRLGGEDAFNKLNQIVPELASMPHADTLKRLLSKIDHNAIQNNYEEILKIFIGSDVFMKLNNGRLRVVVDGSGKFSRRYNWDNHALSRNAGEPDKESYHAYMLDSILVVGDGMAVPLLTEPVENTADNCAGSKQDCELKAFRRLADRLLRLLGKGRVTFMLDGLYACGPVFSLCRSNGWGFMVTLKKDDNKSIWDEFYGLCQCAPEDYQCAMSNGRAQVYTWANGIDYVYGKNFKTIKLNVAYCYETWLDEKPRSGGAVKKDAVYAWVSSEPLNHKNIYDCCMMNGRSRWWVESHFNVEKNQGYHYGHCFSYNWNAMMGFHHLMKIAHFINTLIASSSYFKDSVTAEGCKGFIRKLWDTIIIRGVSSDACNLPKRRGRPSAVGNIDYRSLCLTAAR